MHLTKSQRLQTKSVDGINCAAGFQPHTLAIGFSFDRARSSPPSTTMESIPTELPIFYILVFNPQAAHFLQRLQVPYQHSQSLLSAPLYY